jgi:hypothetical protein
MAKSTDWTAPVPETHRSWVTWIFFFLAVAAAIGSFLDAARYMGWITVGSIGDIDFFIKDTQWLGAIFAGFLGVLWIVVAGWIWSNDTRGWMFVVILATLNLFLLVLALFGSTTWGNIWPALLINGAVLVLAFLPGTQRAFGADESQY